MSDDKLGTCDYDRIGTTCHDGLHEKFVNCINWRESAQPSPCGKEFFCEAVTGRVYKCALPKGHDGDHDDHPTRANYVFRGAAPAEGLGAEQFRKQWSHKPTPIPPDATGLWYVQRFLLDMFQTMVDPVEEFKGNIQQLCELLRKRATEDRETLAGLASERDKRNKHLADIRARWGHVAGKEGCQCPICQKDFNAFMDWAEEDDMQLHLPGGWKDRAERAESALREAREALEKFGRHNVFCKIPSYGEGNKFFDKDCTCGFTEAILALKAEDSSK